MNQEHIDTVRWQFTYFILVHWSCREHGGITVSSDDLRGVTHGGNASGGWDLLSPVLGDLLDETVIYIFMGVASTTVSWKISHTLIARTCQRPSQEVFITDWIDLLYLLWTRTERVEGGVDTFAETKIRITCAPYLLPLLRDCKKQNMSTQNHEISLSEPDQWPVFCLVRKR